MPLNLTRSLLVILIPGAVALAPWLLFALDSLPALAHYYDHYADMSVAFIFCAVVVVGVAFESINSYVENHWDGQLRSDSEYNKRRKARKRPKADEELFHVLNDWYEYLSRICESPPIAHGYLSRTVTTMYAELALMWAVMFFGAGVFRLACDLDAPKWFLLISFFLSVAIPLLLLRTAKDSHWNLCKVRSEVNKRLGPVSQLINPSRNG